MKATFITAGRTGNFIRSTQLYAYALMLVLGACGETISPEQHLQRARDFESQGRFNESVIELKNALQSDPDIAEARLMLGQVYLRQGNGAAAQIELERAVRLGVDTPEVKVAVLRSLLLQRDYAAVLMQAPEIDSPEASADLLALRGEARLGQNNLDMAAEAFQRALELDPKSLPALLGSARMAFSRSEFTAVAGFLDRIEEVDPDNQELWLMRGALGLNNNDMALAESAYRRSLELSAQNTMARLGLARTLLTQGKTEEAREQISIVTRQYPENPNGNFLLGVLELQSGNRDKARDALLQVVRVDPGHLQALLALASIYYEDGQLQQAQSNVELFQVVIPDHLPAQKLAAAIALRLGDAGKAVESLVSVIDKASNDAQFYAMLGSAYLANGDVEKGTEYLAQASAIAPEEASIRTQLALGQLSTGNTEQAIQQLESAVDLDPGLMRADIMLVSVYLREQNFDKALEVAQKALEQDPDNPLYHNLVGAVYIAMKDLDAAEEKFNDALRLEPDFTPAMVNLAMLDLQSNNINGAKKLFADILKLSENNLQSLMGMARIAEMENDSAAAIQHLEKARLGNKYALEPRILLANYYMRVRNYNEALKISREADAIAPDRLAVMNILGQVEDAAGNHDTAIEIFNRMINQAPDAAEGYYRLGVALSRSGESEAALDPMERALKLQPENLILQSGLTTLHLTLGHHDQALALAREISAQHPESPEGLALEADTLQQMGDTAAAIKRYEQAFELQNTGLLAIKLHQVRMKSGARDAAFAGLETWIREHPEDIAARTILAGSYMNLGNRTEAIRQYEKCLEINFDNPVALNNLAWLYHESGDGRALELAEQAYRLEPNLINVVDTLAWILIERDQVERGLTLLRKVVTDDVTDPSVQYHYATGLYKSGDRRRARRELEKLLAGNESFNERTNAQQLLDKIRNEG